MKKNALLILLLLSVSWMLKAQTYSGGSGTSTAPYQIANKADLKYLSEHSDDWDLHFKQTADITFTDTDFESGGDFYNSGKGFIPIGRDTYWDWPANTGIEFTGSYNGQDYEINNLHINRPDRDDVGFFGYVSRDDFVSNPAISHIKILDADVTGKTYTGVLAGRIDYITVQYCETSGKVTGHDHVGGFIGSDWGLWHGSSISYCRAATDVYANSSYYDKEYFGGFMGRIIYDITIDQCYATGDIMIEDYAGYQCGGFIGRIYNDYDSDQVVTNCYATGDLSDNSGAGFIGQVYITSWTDGTFTCSNCYSSGNRQFIQSTFPSHFTNCFYDWQKSSYSTTYSPNIQPKTTDEMKDQSTYTGWNFSSIWAMTSSAPYKNCGYPYLQAIPMPNNAAPDEQSSELSYSNVGTDHFKVSWTNGNGYKNAVFVKEASSGSAYPSNYTTYYSNSTFGNGSQIGTSGWYCVYKGTGSYVNVSGLSLNTTYITHVCSYNCDPGYEMYNTGSASNNPNTQTTENFVTPTTQASNLSFTSVTNDGMSISWTNGSGTSRAVFVKEGSTGTASPSDNTSYSANTTFGSGTQIGTSGWYCVYNGSGTSVIITGLSESTTYITHVCEYNGTPGNQLYNSNTATDNPATQATIALEAPTTQATNIVFSNIGSIGMDLSWTNGNGAKRVVFVKEDNTGNASPEENTTYTANAEFGIGTQIGTSGWYCVYNGTGSSTSISGLSENTSYRVHVCEYNGNAPNEKYLNTAVDENPKSGTTAEGSNNALNFDRTANEYVDLGSPAALDQLGQGSYTIEAWVKTNYTSRQCIIGNYDGTPAWCFELYSAGELRMYINNTGYNSPSASDIDDGEWHHVAGVRDKGSNIIMYVDGEEVYNRGSESEGSFTVSHITRIGAIPWSTHYYFEGDIDEVRIWNTARSQAELIEHMHNELTGNETGLVAYYKMDEGSGTTLNDNTSGGTLNGTIHDATWTSPGAPPDIIWDGSTSTAWNTAGNWNIDAVPDIRYNVFINNETNDPVLNNGSEATFGNLTLNEGAVLNINSGGSLINHGTITNNGTIQNQLTISDGEYHIISPPNNNTVSGLFNGDYLLEWSEPNQEWSYITATNTPLVPATGYYLWGMTKTTTHVFSGTPNTGDQSVALTASGSGDKQGFNLVGNPYPSSIDWATLQPTYGAAYLWNPTSSNYISTTDAAIAPMQGFFVYTASSNTFSLQNANRSHGGTYYKNGNALNKGLVLIASYGDFSDEFRLEFNDQASTGFTLADDAWKLLSQTDGVSQLYSECPDGRLSIDVRPMQPTIQLGFVNSEAGEYTIGLEEMAGVEGALLEDTQENILTDLTQGDYSFSWLPADDEHRFLLHLSVTSITAMETNESVTIYNSGQKLYLTPTNTSTSGVVTVSDLAGHQVLRTGVNLNDVTPVELQVAPGIYLVSFSNEDSSVVKKIIVQ